MLEKKPDEIIKLVQNLNKGGLSVRDISRRLHISYTLTCIYLKGFGSLTEYQKDLARKKGFGSYYKRKKDLAREKGFGSYYKRKKDLAREKGFGSLTEYKEYLFFKKMFNDSLSRLADKLSLTGYGIKNLESNGTNLTVRLLEEDTDFDKGFVESIFRKVLEDGSQYATLQGNFDINYEKNTVVIKANDVESRAFLDAYTSIFKREVIN